MSNILLLFKYWKLLFTQYYPNIPNLKGPKNIVIVRFLRRWWWWEDLRPKSCGYKRKKAKRAKRWKIKSYYKNGSNSKKTFIPDFHIAGDIDYNNGRACSGNETWSIIIIIIRIIRISGSHRIHGATPRYGAWGFPHPNPRLRPRQVLFSLLKDKKRCFAMEIRNHNLSIVQICVLEFLTAKRLRRRLWYIVTRQQLVDSLLSLHPNKFPSFQVLVSIYSLFLSPIVVFYFIYQGVFISKP